MSDIRLVSARIISTPAELDSFKREATSKLLEFSKTHRCDLDAFSGILESKYAAITTALREGYDVEAEVSVTPTPGLPLVSAKSKKDNDKPTPPDGDDNGQSDLGSLTPEFKAYLEVLKDKQVAYLRARSEFANLSDKISRIDILLLDNDIIYGNYLKHAHLQNKRADLVQQLQAAKDAVESAQRELKEVRDELRSQAELLAYTRLDLDIELLLSAPVKQDPDTFIAQVMSDKKLVDLINEFNNKAERYEAEAKAARIPVGSLPRLDITQIAKERYARYSAQEDTPKRTRKEVETVDIPQLIFDEVARIVASTDTYIRRLVKPDYGKHFFHSNVPYTSALPIPLLNSLGGVKPIPTVIAKDHKARESFIDSWQQTLSKYIQDSAKELANLDNRTWQLIDLRDAGGTKEELAAIEAELNAIARQKQILTCQYTQEDIADIKAARDRVLAEIQEFSNRHKEVLVEGLRTAYEEYRRNAHIGDHGRTGNVLAVQQGDDSFENYADRVLRSLPDLLGTAAYRNYPRSGSIVPLHIIGKDLQEELVELLRKLEKLPVPDSRAVDTNKFGYEKFLREKLATDYGMSQDDITKAIQEAQGHIVLDSVVSDSLILPDISPEEAAQRESGQGIQQIAAAEELDLEVRQELVDRTDPSTGVVFPGKVMQQSSPIISEIYTLLVDSLKPYIIWEKVKDSDGASVKDVWREEEKEAYLRVFKYNLDLSGPTLVDIAREISYAFTSVQDVNLNTVRSLVAVHFPGLSILTQDAPPVDYVIPSLATFLDISSRASEATALLPSPVSLAIFNILVESLNVMQPDSGVSPLPADRRIFKYNIALDTGKLVGIALALQRFFKSPEEVTFDKVSEAVFVHFNSLHIMEIPDRPRPSEIAAESQSEKLQQLGGDVGATAAESVSQLRKVLGSLELFKYEPNVQAVLGFILDETVQPPIIDPQANYSVADLIAFARRAGALYAGPSDITPDALRELYSKYFRDISPSYSLPSAILGEWKYTKEYSERTYAEAEEAEEQEYQEITEGLRSPIQEVEKVFKMLSDTSNPILAEINPFTNAPFTKRELYDLADRILVEFGGKAPDSADAIKRSEAILKYRPYPDARTVADIRYNPETSPRSAADLIKALRLDLNDPDRQLEIVTAESEEVAVNRLMDQAIESAAILKLHLTDSNLDTLKEHFTKFVSDLVAKDRAEQQALERELKAKQEAEAAEKAKKEAEEKADMEWRESLGLPESSPWDEGEDEGTVHRQWLIVATSRDSMVVQAKVVKRRGGWYVLSEKGKNLGGPYDSRLKADKRLHQVEFFKHQSSKLKPAPSAEEIAKKHGVSVEKVHKQLAIGKKIEREHTSDATIAQTIAAHHLMESIEYYTALKKMEKGLDKSSSLTTDVFESAMKTLFNTNAKGPKK